MNERARRLLPVWISVASILPFLPALTAPFLEWDDALNLVENVHWRGFSPGNVRWMLTTLYSGPYQPLSWLSYALDYTLWGANPAAMRATNFLLHAASAALFFLVVDALIERASPEAPRRERAVAAAFAALFWAAHPLRVESVVWLTERRDVLSGFFYLLTVLLYVRAPRRPLRPLFAYCLAVLAKASVITLPLSLIVLDVWPLRRRSWTDKIPYFAISLAAGLTGVVGQADTGMLKGAEVGIGERVALTVYSLWWYAAKTVAPFGLSAYHRVPPGFGLASPLVWAAAAGATALGAVAWSARQRAPAVTAALVLYAIALAPMAGFVRFGHHLVAERYSYLPGLALSALAGAALLAARRVPGQRATATAVAAALLLVNAGAAASYARDWSGTESLWKRALRVDPDSILPHVNLASYYRRASQLAYAHEEEQAAVTLDPTLGQQWNNLGTDAIDKKNYAEAVKMLRSAIAASPDLAAAHYNLSIALTALGRRGEAIAELEKAARLDFNDPKTLNNLGVALSGAGENDRAEAALGQAIRLTPDWPAAHYNHGNALAALGRPAEALAEFKEAARLDPRFALAWINAGSQLARAGRLREAKEDFLKALAISPKNEAARADLAEVKRALGER